MLKMTVEHIGPQEAAEYLKNMKTQREPKAGPVKRLVATMKEGRWLLTGDPIRFDESGRLIDGGHRLTAVIQSGHAIETVVIRGLSKKVVDFLDQFGVKRQLGQVLADKGLLHAALLAAMLTWIWRERNGLLSSGRCVTIHDGLKIMKEEGLEDSDILSVACPRARVFPAISGSLWAYLGWRLPTLSTQERSDNFLQSLCEGAGMERGDPILTLRDQLASRRKSVGATCCASRLVLPFIMMGWEDYLRGVKRIKAYTFNPSGKDGDKWPTWARINE